jgi:hypothetical protein
MDRMESLRGVTHRYVFVAGLHRTGTSLLAGMIGAHDDVSAIENAPVPENEGCYLQGAIPHTALDGIPGEYATDPAQHLTERHALNSLETVRRIEADWAAWFDPAKPWRLEKSPVNLTRLRLLQGLFPLAHFVIITRHPSIMAQALTKWSQRSAPDLAAYGVSAYRQMLEDVRYLHHALVIRYEDLVRHPQPHLDAIFGFMGLATRASTAILRDGNADYAAVPGSSGTIRELGYAEGGAVGPFDPMISHPLRQNREACRAAFASARDRT